MKNVSYKFNHEKLGQLVIAISSGDSIDNANNIIPATFVVKNKKTDPREFLFKLYELFMGKNDTMTDIIGDYLTTNLNNTTTEKLAEDISSKYASIINKKNAKQDAPISSGDGIDIRISKVSAPNTPLYTANVIVKKRNGGLTAYIDEQVTEEQYQKQGLMTLAIGKYLPKYCASNDISSITLETGEIGGVDKNQLKKIYQNLGFEMSKNGLFEKPVACENSLDFNM